MTRLALFLVVGSACSLDSEPEIAGVEQALENQMVTRINVNGISAFTFLEDSAGTNGFLTATKDQIAHTTALDFSYATPTVADPHRFIIFQGAGQIPNSSFSANLSTASLTVTTPASYQVIRCELNDLTGESTCAPSGPLSFNMTWTANGVTKIKEETKRKIVQGPVTTKFKGEYESTTANVNGTWGGRSSPNMPGELQDFGNTTIIREITVTMQ